MSYRSYRRGNNARDGAVHTNAVNALPPDREITDGLINTPVKTLAKPAESAGKNIAIKELEYIGSYNWTNSAKPTIIIPGSPSEWRTRMLPYKVPRDSGIRFVDQNGFRMPSSTLYPLLRTVDIVSEENGDSIDWGSVDFVTDRNGLRKILRWINDDNGSAREFRIDTQLGGSRTVLLNRWEKRTREEPDPTRRTYGFSFERESTTKAKGCEQSTGHHRIVKYDFDGLTLVVRFEVDACLASPRAQHPTPSSSNVDSLSDMLSALNVTSTQSTSKVDGDASTSELDVIRGGSQVPQSSIIEMTTRSRNYAHLYDWEDAYPQLYLSQTPHHYLAVHNRGDFEAITKRALGDAEMKRIEAAAQSGFRKLRVALQTIQDLVAEHGQRGRLSLVYRGGQLRVFERTSNDSCLPKTMLMRFEA